ncbi:MAG: membrane protein insertion efficiency factor YidD [Candidatus Omnitrophica bacterium]|nr:membrane protein insertion efficiency factor YidD [Candidatus Omnitrophota bacterium]
MIKNIALKCVDFYRKYLSILKIQSCRYHPTCSAYTKEAIEKYGVFRGCFKGAMRLLRCHPFSRGGYDPLT